MLKRYVSWLPEILIISMKGKDEATMSASECTVSAHVIELTMSQKVTFLMASEKCVTRNICKLKDVNHVCTACAACHRDNMITRRFTPCRTCRLTFLS